LTKRRFIKDGTQTSAEARRFGGKTAETPKKPTIANPAQGGAGKLRGAQNGGAARFPQAPEKAAESAGRGFGETGKGTIKTAKKSVKTADRSAKAAVKTARRTAKSARKSARTAAKAARAGERAARTAARAAARSAKTAGRAIAATAKAAIAAARGIAVVLAASACIAVPIVLIVCTVGLLAGSAFGIFFSGEQSGAGRSVSDAVSELGAEFYRKIDEIKEANAHDAVELGAISVPWEEVLAVYAVKVTGDAANPREVVTFDDEKLAALRGVLRDMVSLSSSLRTDATENEAGEVSETVTLAIEAEHKSPDEMAALYGFGKSQTDMLHELLSDEYKSLWAGLFGGYAAGGGEIAESRADYVSLDILSWPLPENFRISSGFSQRRDPFTGETEYHGGIDIAAPAGTPILAAADGTVTFANVSDVWGCSRGYYLTIRHDGGLATLYAHCLRIAVLSGEAVKKRQIVAYVGSTGNSTGNHLHFEVHRNGARTDLLGFFAD
jgi:murein DD-endopeptidase MepM/ murein hydrolase activator NlpD